MKNLILLLLLLSSCTAELEPMQYNTFFYASYPPGSCKNLKPDICNLTIDGKDYSLEVIEVKGGLQSGRVMLEEGIHYLSRVEILDINGNMTHFVADDFDDKGWVVMHLKEPMKFMVGDKSPWINGQLFCSGWLDR